MPLLTSTTDQNVRFTVRNDLLATISVDRNESRPDEYRARLVDLSQSGAKLSVDTELEITDRVTLCLKIPELQLDLRVPGEICWCQSMVGSRWLLGCQLKPILPADLLAQLTTSRCPDRRNTTRQELQVELQGRSPTHPRPLNVRVDDLSQAGVRIWSPHPLQVGRRVRLYREEFTQRGAAEITVQWQCQVCDGHLLGCRFSGEDGFATLTRILETSEPSDPQPAP